MSAKLVIYNKSKKFELKVKKVNSITKYIGLMFKTIESPPLLFEFSYNSRPAIHSFFVFFPFIALWLDDKNNVLEYNLVKPFSPLVRPTQDCKNLLELPLNKENRRLIGLLVGKGKI
ncbi:MAG: hypothetical protein Q7S74_03980 [Nanoarchaeota archaeon]|nr:hypothetical protein [Nanoarchaeota archaeon]